MSRGYHEARAAISLMAIVLTLGNGGCDGGPKGDFTAASDYSVNDEKLAYERKRLRDGDKDFAQFRSAG
jgi:hypothetical protein